MVIGTHSALKVQETRGTIKLLRIEETAAMLLMMCHTDTSVISCGSNGHEDMGISFSAKPTPHILMTFLVFKL